MGLLRRNIRLWSLELNPYILKRPHFTHALKGGGLRATRYALDSLMFISAGNEPRGLVYMSIWPLPQGSNTPMLASLLV